ncbi:MAG TPA: F0F1 ATP synthase subunit delta, partial [Candidatus Nanopelagicales bacterium]|nr:F0F1 ATP synthase subunit delta [Candidatus Nanopelagicales bacterium]
FLGDYAIKNNLQFVKPEKSTGKKVAITHKQDPSLIAGVVTQIGDQVIDGSVRARLSSFRESLLRT